MAFGIVFFFLIFLLYLFYLRFPALYEPSINVCVKSEMIPTSASALFSFTSASGTTVICLSNYSTLSHMFIILCIFHIFSTRWIFYHNQSFTSLILKAISNLPIKLLFESFQIFLQLSVFYFVFLMCFHVSLLMLS